MDVSNWKTFKDKALTAVNNAAQEVDHQLALTKLRVQLKHDQDLLDREYQRLGTVCYQSLSKTGSVSTGSPDIAPILTNISRYQDALRASQKAVDEAAASSSRTKCPACGTEITTPQAKFCSSCGNVLS
ncbi:MAG: zinc-ribbon domain-containing protein [Firmicutes bacterium]|uniref:Putative zinc-ribbon domain-containing protein n=1 Tax=Sulfobacillus benefaciens TaxID=453960 RepID=A0A2T2WVS2_9FIRM|nr:zinc-ribbon domain-containing protein [Bacillota bacterium]MCL5013354.1 zinc-ribbon domain-containing protein [Bacillota bacterium]PSR26341.1 MAG: hypothetical protein C7B43_14135 [Sulfobacillus benefaciens]